MNLTQDVLTPRAYHASALKRAGGREPGVWFTLLCLVVGAIGWLDGMIERKRQRNALAELDDRLLSDIGLSRYDADHEIAKPFWR